jgi:REP element-mobilizing transposase RayT
VDERRMPHTYSNINLHVIYGVKDRRNALYADMRPRLLDMLSGILTNIGVQTIEANAVDDHAHALIRIKPSHAPSDVLMKLKSNSSRWIHDTFPQLRLFQWQGGFSAFSVSASQVAEVAKYIRDQEKHHRRISYEEELRRFLEKHGIDFDPRHFP